MKLRKSQNGFSAIEILLLILLLLLLIFLGWYVWNKKESKPPANSSSNATPAKTETKATETPQSTVNYLKIPEWGVKVKLSDDIKDAYYDNKVTTNLSAFSLRVHSLDSETQCKNDPQSLSTIFKVGKDEPSDQDPTTTYAKMEKGVVIGDSFYFISRAQYNCTSDASKEALLNKAIKAFTDASPNIEKL